LPQLPLFACGDHTRLSHSSEINKLRSLILPNVILKIQDLSTRPFFPLKFFNNNLALKLKSNSEEKAYPPNFAETTECRRTKFFSANLGGFGVSQREFFCFFCTDLIF